MRRSASEILRNLEIRIARLERKASNIDMKTIKEYFGDVGEIRYYDEVSNNRILLNSRAVNDILKEILKITQDCIVNGKLDEGEIVYCNEIEIGKILINEEYPFALIKFSNENFNKDLTLKSKNGSFKIFIPEWLKI
jgi:hypothetical protein